MLSNCVNYRINISTIPEKEVEVYLNGAPKGKTDSASTLEFERKKMLFTWSPVIFVKKDDFEGWFRYYNVNDITYKNLCDFKVNILPKERTINIGITFLTDSAFDENLLNRCSLKETNYYQRDYELRPPFKPVGLTFLGILFTGIGIAGDIIGIAWFVDAKNTEETWFFGPDFSRAMGRLFLIPGTISLAFGASILVFSTPRWRDYNEWRYYDDRAESNRLPPVGIFLNKEF